jgi:hypothetical protein
MSNDILNLITNSDIGSSGILRPRRRRPAAGKARWAAGRWTLIAERRLDTHRPDDVVIGNGTFIWVGVFDHTLSRHTRHIRPIQLELK